MSMGLNPINIEVLCTRVSITSFLDITFCLYDETLITYVLKRATTLSIMTPGIAIKMPHTKYVHYFARVLQTYTRNLGSPHLGHATSVQALCQFKIATAKEHLFEVTEHK